MTDYTRATGSSGTMMIRDSGGYIEFWLQAGSLTYNHQLNWGYTINGVTGTGVFDFVSGGGWQRLGRWAVNSSQTVTFRLMASGTSGLGGPTTFAVAINRATIPPAPILAISSYTATSATLNSTNNGNGGSTLDQWQLGYGTNPSYPVSYMNLNLSTGDGTVTGLAKGSTYYFWARVHNAFGWSGWSARASLTTWKEPPAPTTPVVTAGPTQNSVTVKYLNQGNGGTAILEYQLAFDKVNPPVTTMVGPNNGIAALSNLSAGDKYYFRVRARNAVGWGAWSGILTVQLKAGAYVKMGVTWKRAVPYVRVNGVWKVAQPYVKIAGLWKQTS